jgi:hypothetical protein
VAVLVIEGVGDQLGDLEADGDRVRENDPVIEVDRVIEGVLV